jgi:predicted transcriptional regulator
MNEIIKSLKKARIERKLKQSELGSKLGLPQSHISKIEQGDTDLRLSTVADMARLLDLELVLVPRHMLPVIKAIIEGKEEQKPMWVLDEEKED